MRTHHISVLLGLAPLASILLAPIPVKAAALDYDFSQLRFLDTQPIDSDVFLDFQGSPSQNQGFVAFYNQDPNALDRGHTLIGQNSRVDIPGAPDNAPYYGTGRQSSPEEPFVDATRSATLVDNSGFFNFNSYLIDNGIELDNIGFAFGQKEDVDFTKTWNLGADTFGENWFADPNSPLEERIYSANPNDVELALYNGLDKIIEFGYSDFFSIVDYGATTSFGDDTEINYTDPVSVNKVSSLDSLNDGLADSFIADVLNTGDKVQFVNSFEGEDLVIKSGNGFDSFILPYPLQVRVVEAVPENTFTWALLIFGASNLIFRRKKPSNLLKSKSSIER